MPDMWYLRIRGRVLGPLSVLQLRDLYSKRQLQGHHEVSQDQINWHVAARVPGLLLPTTPPILTEPVHVEGPVVHIAARRIPQWLWGVCFGLFGACTVLIAVLLARISGTSNPQVVVLTPTTPNATVVNSEDQSPLIASVAKQPNRPIHTAPQLSVLFPTSPPRPPIPPLVIKDPAYRGPSELVRTFEGHKDSVTTVAFSPDDQSILSGSLDKTVRLWNATGTQQAAFETRWIPPKSKIEGEVRAQSYAFRDHVWAVTSTLDGKQILAGCSGDDGVNEKAMATANDLFGKFGSLAALARDRRSSLRLWDIVSKREQGRFGEFAESVFSIAISRDGKRALLGTGGRLKAVLLWDLDSGREIKRFEGHTAAVSAVAWSPDEKTILSCSFDGTVALWNIDNGRQIHLMAKHRDAVNAVAYLPDGEFAISAGADLSVKLWDLRTGEHVRDMLGHTKRVRALAVSPDGLFAISGGEDASIRIWALASGREIRQLKGHKETVWCISFSHDGKYLVSGGGGSFTERSIGGGKDNVLILWGLPK